MDAPVIANVVAVVALLVAVASVWAAFGSRNEARRSREIADEALSDARTSTQMAVRSAKTAEETRHDAIAPVFRVKSAYNDQLDVAWVRLELIQAPAPIQVRVRLDGTLFCSDGGGYRADEEAEFTSLVAGDDDEFVVTHPDGIPPIGMSAPVTVRSIRTRDRWDDPNVVPWEWFWHIRWGSDLSREP